MVHADVGNLGEELLGLLGIPVDPGLALGEELGAASLDHVAEQGPWRTAEADERHPSLELLPGEGDGIVDVAKLVGHVDVPLKYLLVLAVVGVLQGLREVRPLLVHHLHHHPHCLRDHQDVGEDDGGINQALESLDGLKGKGRCDLWVPAALEEITGPLGLVVLG